MVKRKFQISFNVFLVGVFTLLFTPLALAVNKDFIVIGTGGVTGVYYPTGGAICSLLNKSKDQQLRCSAESTAGSEYNLTALRQGNLDFALVQSDVQYNAFNGKEQFADAGAFTSLRSVFSLHVEAMTFVAKPGSQATQFSELKNQRVSLGNFGSGQRITLELMLKEMGEDLSYFLTATNLRAAEMPTALCNNQVDAMSYVVGHPNSSIKEATTNCKGKILAVDDELITKLLENRPYYIKTVIAGNEYANNPHDVKTFGVVATFVTDAATDDEIVYKLVKSVFENFDAFKKRHPAFAHLSKTSMVTSGLTAPLHPGALSYYREAGLIN